MLTLLRVTFWIGLVAVGLFLGFAWWGDRVHQERVFGPVAALGVTELDYISEAGEGIGPGANESGIHVFILPDARADAIARGGSDYLNRLGMPELDWRPTPVSGDPGWPGPDGAQPAIADIIEQYFVIAPVRDDIRALADRILTTEGGFYALRGGRVFLVSPQERRVVFAYGG